MNFEDIINIHHIYKNKYDFIRKEINEQENRIRDLKNFILSNYTGELERIWINKVINNSKNKILKLEKSIENLRNKEIKKRNKITNQLKQFIIDSPTGLNIGSKVWFLRTGQNLTSLRDIGYTWKGVESIKAEIGIGLILKNTQEGYLLLTRKKNSFQFLEESNCYLLLEKAIDALNKTSILEHDEVIYNANREMLRYIKKYFKHDKSQEIKFRSREPKYKSGQLVHYFNQKGNDIVILQGKITKIITQNVNNGSRENILYSINDKFIHESLIEDAEFLIKKEI